MAPSISRYLTSPTIRLVPDPPASQPCSDTQFIVHRSLLTAQSPYYLKKRTRESYIVLENTTEETVALFLEWLYQGDYEVPSAEIDEEDEEAEDDQQNPVVKAAMAGPVGVWGRKQAAFGRRYVAEKARSEGLNSLYVSWAADGSVTVKGAEEYEAQPAQTTGNPALTAALDQHQLPSPPDSPTPQHQKPLFPNTDNFPQFCPESQDSPEPMTIDALPASAVFSTPTVKEPGPTPETSLSLVLASHLALYVFSLRYHIPALSHLSLTKLSDTIRANPPTPQTLVGFIRAVYYDSEETGGDVATLTRGSYVRGFVARYTAYRLEEMRAYNGFKKLLAQGGEFAVDLVGEVMGGKGVKGTEDVWVR